MKIEVRLEKNNYIAWVGLNDKDKVIVSKISKNNNKNDSILFLEGLKNDESLFDESLDLETYNKVLIDEVVVNDF